MMQLRNYTRENEIEITYMLFLHVISLEQKLKKDQNYLLQFFHPKVERSSPVLLIAIRGLGAPGANKRHLKAHQPSYRYFAPSSSVVGGTRTA